MKLAKTNIQEIDSLMDLLSEIEQINKHFVWDGEYFQEFKNELAEEKETLPICLGIVNECHSKDEFYQLVFARLSGIHFQRILWNCSTLLENCANPDLSHLDFNDDIKRGFELLEGKNDILVNKLKSLKTAAELPNGNTENGGYVRAINDVLNFIKQ